MAQVVAAQVALPPRAAAHFAHGHHRARVADERVAPVVLVSESSGKPQNRRAVAEIERQEGGVRRAGAGLLSDVKGERWR